MALFGRKIYGSVFVKDSNKYHVSLIELANHKDIFLRFVLFLKIDHPAKKRVDMVRHIHLEETDVKKAIRRYFSPHGGVRKNFPGIKYGQWKIVRPWLLKVADSSKIKSDWMRVDKSYVWSRPRSGSRFWNRFASRHALLLGKK